MTYQGLINVVEVAGKDGFGWHFALLSGTGPDRPWLAGNPTPLKGWWIAGCRKELLGFIDLTPASASMSHREAKTDGRKQPWEGPKSKGA